MSKFKSTFNKPPNPRMLKLKIRIRIRGCEKTDIWHIPNINLSVSPLNNLTQMH